MPERVFGICGCLVQDLLSTHQLCHRIVQLLRGILEMGLALSRYLLAVGTYDRG
jgi:hypothetical protein